MRQGDSTRTAAAAGPLRWLVLGTHVPASGVGGGMVRYAVEITRALTTRPDVEVHVLALPESLPFFADLLGTSDRVWPVPGRLPTPARSLLERSARTRAFRRHWDIVQGCKHLVPRRVYGRRVLTVHDMLVLDRPHDYPWFKRTLLAGPYLASIRDADVLLCVSEATRMRLLRHVPEAASRVRVVPHAVSPTLHRVLPEPVAALEGRPFGLVVGDSSRRKNLGFVLELWRRVSAQQPAAVLAVVGPEGWGISDLGAGGDAATRTDVALLGHLPEEQLRWCYQNAEVVLCPSLVEGFGLPALEALEFGATVVTSTDPALVEVSGDRALHLPADDAGPWVRAILGAFSGSGSRPTHCGARRTWDRVAAETVQAVRDSS